MLKIRRGTPADLPEVAAIQQDSPEAAQWDVGDYLGRDFVVASGEGRVWGFLVSRRVADDETELLNLGVAPAARRRGVGTALVAHLLASGGAIYLEVRESNRVAREFYKSIGFQEITVRKDYYDHPPDAAIVMKFHSC